MLRNRKTMRNNCWFVVGRFSYGVFEGQYFVYEWVKKNTHNIDMQSHYRMYEIIMLKLIRYCSMSGIFCMILCSWLHNFHDRLSHMQYVWRFHLSCYWILIGIWIRWKKYHDIWPALMWNHTRIMYPNYCWFLSILSFVKKNWILSLVQIKREISIFIIISSARVVPILHRLMSNPFYSLFELGFSRSWHESDRQSMKSARSRNVIHTAIQSCKWKCAWIPTTVRFMWVMFNLEITHRDIDFRHTNIHSHIHTMWHIRWHNFTASQTHRIPKPHDLLGPGIVCWKPVWSNGLFDAKHHAVCSDRTSNGICGRMVS